MKIGYLLEIGEELQSPPFNGPANHIRHVFNELSARGHQVCLLYRHQGQIWKSTDLSSFCLVIVHRTDKGIFRLVESGARRIQMELRLPYIALFESVRFSQACLQEISDCDLYYERISWMAYGGMLAARTRKLPWIAEYNGDPLADLEGKGAAPAGLQRRIAKFLFRSSLQKANHVIASGEGWRESCIHTWGVKPEKVTTVENGTDLLNSLQRNDLRSFGDFSPNSLPVEIVYLGGFYPWHGIHILLEACARAIQSGVRLHLVLIGSGDGLPAAQQRAAELGLEGHVDFIGRLSVEEYTPYLANAEIGVSPYCGWEEFSGLKLFDYKAAGLACIASGKDGHPQTLRHGETGWIVPPCDIDALTNALVKLVGDAELRRRLGQAARIEAECLHSWTHTVDRLESVIDAFV